MTQQIFVGVDVTKDWLDIHHPSRGATRIDNSLAAARSSAARCARDGVWVVFEASGGVQPARAATSEACKSDSPCSTPRSVASRT